MKKTFITLDKAYGSPSNANMKFKGAKGIEERDLQKLYFERCKAAADDGTGFTFTKERLSIAPYPNMAA